MARYTKPEDLQHITTDDLCANFDTILDSITSEDKAIAVDSNTKCYVICPLHWLDEWSTIKQEVENYEVSNTKRP